MSKRVKRVNPVVQQVYKFLIWVLLLSLGLRFVANASWLLIGILISFFIIKEVLDYYTIKSNNAHLDNKS